ncbi:MAG: hypothetical protein ACJA0X_003308 [Cyclobacteriaceae bacterium]
MLARAPEQYSNADWRKYYSLVDRS